MNRNGLLLVLLGTLLVFGGSSVSLLRRHQVERANATVTLAMESDALAALATGERLSFDEALKRAKAGGIGGLVLSEETLGEILTQGRASLTPGMGGSSFVASPSEVPRTPPDLTGEPGYQVTVTDAALRRRIEVGLRIRFGDRVVLKGDTFQIPATDVGFLRSTPILLDDTWAEAGRRAGMRIIARAGNPIGIGAAGVRETLQSLKDQGATVFLPQGDQVLGRRAATPAAVEALRETGMLYASPEFAKLGGDVEMLKAMPDRTVRLHAAQTAELDKLSAHAAVERYTKAASERNMRILLLRPLGGAADRPLGAFIDLAEAITKGMARDRLSPGEAKPFRDPAPPAALKIVIGLGIAVATIGTALLLRVGRTLMILAGLAALGSALGTLKPSTADLSALWAALVFPCAGFLAAFEGRMRLPLALLVATGVSLAGGLAVAGLLNGLPYLVRAEAFSGVKLAVFLPVVLIGIFAFARLADLKTAMREPITWGSALLGLGLLVGLMVLLVRSGNDAPAGVSGGELAFRGLLEEILPVRPRTKSFLIGFPALFLGFAWLSSVGYDAAKLRNRGGWIALLMMGGAVALTDTVNTFCHLHTPIYVSALRVLIGFIIGTVGGAILWFALRPVLNRA